MKTVHKSIIYETIFQVILIGLVFIFYAFEREKGQIYASIDSYEFAFYFNYVVATMLINYFFLPRLLYKKKYLYFILSAIVVLSVVIFIEEGVIEQIYFPTTRGMHFPGVAVNLMTALPTITILVGAKFAWDAIRQRNQMDVLESKVKESELQFLKTQINPHFLFNNLNNLYAHALDKSDQTPEIVLELSSVLRYMLYECKEEFVSLDKEVEQLENFINLSKLQFQDRGEVVFNKEVNNHNLKVAPLILSVFVENAFKHSAASKIDDINISIDLKQQSNKLLFTCSNTFSDSTNTDDLGKGIGLENVKKRLDILYGKNHELVIDNSNHLYSVSLSMELEQL